MEPLSYDRLMADSGLERSEARLLLGHVTGRSKSWLIARGNEIPDAAQARQAGALFSRRRAGEPVAYLLGEREFYAHRFHVGPGVLIPRPETEMLVEWGVEFLQTASPPQPLRALDLGCGSGCIGLSLALEAHRLGLGLTALTQTDIATEALAFTRRNAVELGVTAWPGFAYECLQGSWFEALSPGRQFDLILSNPPYIRSDDAHLQQGDLRFEPPHALVSGASGLRAIEEIARYAVDFLRPGGALMLEHGFDQAESVRAILRDRGFQAVATRQDLAGHPRLTGGCQPI